MNNLPKQESQTVEFKSSYNDEVIRSLNSSWDAYPDTLHTLDDISLEKVQKCIEIMREIGLTITDTPLSFLFKFNLLREERPTNAAYLMFKNNYKSTPRNKAVAYFFKNMRIIEKYGAGIQRIIDYFKNENRTIPEFRNISDGFMVTVFDSFVNNITEKKNDTKNNTKNQKLILKEIEKNPHITSKELSEIIGIIPVNIRVNLSKLKENGIIERVGGKKGGYWIIKSKK